MVDDERAALDLLASWNDAEGGDDEPSPAPKDVTSGRGRTREGHAWAWHSRLQKQQNLFFLLVVCPPPWIFR